MQYYARDTCKTSPFKWWQLKSLLLRQMDFTGHLTECSKNCMTSCWWLYCQKRRSWDLIVKKTPGKEMEKNSEKNFNPDYNLRKCLECCEDQDLRKSSRFKELEKKKKKERATRSNAESWEGTFFSIKGIGAVGELERILWQ